LTKSEAPSPPPLTHTAGGGGGLAVARRGCPPAATVTFRVTVAEHAVGRRVAPPPGGEGLC